MSPVRDAGSRDVLWIGGYPAHYVRAMHCEVERLRPDTFHFLYLAQPNASVRAYERGDMPHSSEIFSASAHLIRFIRKLVRSKPRLVILSGYNGVLGKCALIWACVTRQNFCVWSDTHLLDVLQRSRVHQFFRKTVLKALLGRATRALYIGSRNRDYWIWLLGMDQVKPKLYHLPYPACLIPEGLPGSKPRETFTILFVGRLDLVKGVEKLLKAIARVRPQMRSSLKLHIYGTGPEERNLVSCAQKLGLSGIVEFHGAVPSDQVAEAYRNADLFVLPSEQEPWGLVVNEALSAGVPVMCPYWIGASADLVIDEVTGFVLPDNDAATISAAVEKAVGAPIGELGECGKRLVTTGPWNCDAAVRRLIQLVDADPGPRPR